MCNAYEEDDDADAADADVAGTTLLHAECVYKDEEYVWWCLHIRRVNAAYLKRSRANMFTYTLQYVLKYML